MRVRGILKQKEKKIYGVDYRRNEGKDVEGQVTTEGGAG